MKKRPLILLGLFWLFWLLAITACLSAAQDTDSDGGAAERGRPPPLARQLV